MDNKCTLQLAASIHRYRGITNIRIAMLFQTDGLRDAIHIESAIRFVKTRVVHRPLSTFREEDIR